MGHHRFEVVTFTVSIISCLVNSFNKFRTKVTLIQQFSISEMGTCQFSLFWCKSWYCFQIQDKQTDIGITLKSHSQQIMKIKQRPVLCSMCICYLRTGTLSLFTIPFRVSVCKVQPLYPVCHNYLIYSWEKCLPDYNVMVCLKAPTGHTFSTNTICKFQYWWVEW